MAAEGQQESRVARLAGLIESDCSEMPGARLTRAQMRRLWNLSTGKLRPCPCVPAPWHRSLTAGFFAGRCGIFRRMREPMPRRYERKECPSAHTNQPSFTVTP